VPDESLLPDRDNLIEIRNLRVSFPLEQGTIDAVDDVSLTIPRAGTVGLVGESGCGKSMTGLSLLQLIARPGRITQGEILYRRAPDAPIVDIAALPPLGDEIRRLRGKEIAMIFQEPMSSLNPVYTIGQQIAEALRLHQRMNAREARAHAIEMLNRVGIPAPQQRVDEFPHQLSGGMRQRAMIAIALSCDPALVIADEPTTALDVTVQAQILDLLRDLQAERGMALLLISHDLGVIADLAEEVIVMYAGKIVERAEAQTLFDAPQHPYTRGLLRAAPALGKPTPQRLYSIPGTVPSPLRMPRGCSFRPRCPERYERCLEPPHLVETTPNHLARCWARQEPQDVV
jgi:oligopeptide/dipeptide ABC transporter ATP-binding protein